MPGFDFITQQVGQIDTNPYILWILGGLFLFVAALGTIIVRMALLMFQWRREIDKEHAISAIAIASLATLKPDVERNSNDIRNLNNRITKMTERRFIVRDRDEDDIF